MKTPPVQRKLIFRSACRHGLIPSANRNKSHRFMFTVLGVIRSRRIRPPPSGKSGRCVDGRWTRTFISAALPTLNKTQPQSCTYCGWKSFHRFHVFVIVSNFRNQRSIGCKCPTMLTEVTECARKSVINYDALVIFNSQRSVNCIHFTHRHSTPT